MWADIGFELAVLPFFAQLGMICLLRGSKFTATNSKGHHIMRFDLCQDFKMQHLIFAPDSTNLPVDSGVVASNDEPA